MLFWVARSHLFCHHLPIAGLHAFIEGTLDTHVLALFGRIMKGDSPLLYNLSLRQLALKDFTSKSWFIHLVRLCGKYDLPLPHRLVDGSITPQSWNSLVKRTVFSFWFRTMSQDAITKSTLRFISIDLLAAPG